MIIQTFTLSEEGALYLKLWNTNSVWSTGGRVGWVKCNYCQDILKVECSGNHNKVHFTALGLQAYRRMVYNEP